MANPSTEAEYRKEPAHDQVTRTHYLGSNDFELEGEKLTSVRLAPNRILDVKDHPILGRPNFRNPNRNKPDRSHIIVTHPPGEPNVLCDVVYFHPDLPTLDPKPIGSRLGLMHRLVIAARWSSVLGGEAVLLKYRSDRLEPDDFAEARFETNRSGCFLFPELKQGVTITVIDESHVKVAVGRYVDFDPKDPISLHFL